MIRRKLTRLLPRLLSRSNFSTDRSTALYGGFFYVLNEDMHRPIKLTPDGATAITLHKLHKQLANDLTAHGEYFFKPSDLMDVLGLAHTPEETREAISCLLSMTKELKGNQLPAHACRLQGDRP